MRASAKLTTGLSLARRSALRLSLLLVAVAVLMGMPSSTAAASGEQEKTIGAEITLTETTNVCLYTKLGEQCLKLDVGAKVRVSVTYTAAATANVNITTEPCARGLCVFVYLDAHVSARIDVFVATCGLCLPALWESFPVGAAVHEQKVLCLALIQ